MVSMRIHSDAFVYGVLNAMKVYLLKAKNLNFTVHLRNLCLPISETAMPRYIALIAQKSVFSMADGCLPLIASVWNRFQPKAICFSLQVGKRMCSHCMHTASMPSASTVKRHRYRKVSLRAFSFAFGISFFCMMLTRQAYARVIDKQNIWRNTRS